MKRDFLTCARGGVSTVVICSGLWLAAVSSRGQVSNLCDVPLFGERWEIRSKGPGQRQNLTAVWSGSEMLVWGGGAGVFLNDGGRYNPLTDTWQFITPSNAPVGRWMHGAVWTGTEMLVWGGRRDFWPAASLNDGGRYDPLTDSWEPITTQGAPSPRAQFVPVWTGSEMLVWGGMGDGWVCFSSGGRYNPVSDTWTPMNTNGAPSPRFWPAIVWTGTEMIIWGGGIFPHATSGPGICFNDGARYNPTTDQWTPLPTNGAPPAAHDPLYVWTGREMIVWGGQDISTTLNRTLDTGGRYDPATDSWRSMSAANVPTSRVEITAVWTGEEMWVWGGTTLTASGSGQINSGGRYNPDCDTWNPLTLQNPPPPRSNAGLVWSGQAALIFGGNVGGSDYDSNFAWIPGTPASLPGITQQPEDQTVLAGTNVTISVTVTGSPPMNLQWQFKGTNVPGATSSTLVLTNVQLEDGGIYTVTITNSLGGVVSDPARLTVLAAPIILVQPQGQIGYWGKAVSFSVTARGSRPLSYQWFKDGFAIPGATTFKLNLTNLDFFAGADYFVVVSNSVGSVTSSPALLVLNAAGISIGLYPGVTVDGVVGRTYGIQYTLDVSHTNSWATLTNFTLTQPVQLWFDTSADAMAGAVPRRFYRVVAVP